MRVQEEEAGVALDWLKENHMIANPSKFHALLIKKDQTKTSGEKLSIQAKTIESEDSVKLLGVQLDYKLNFDPHISELCRKAAAQLISILYWFRREKSPCPELRLFKFQSLSFSMAFLFSKIHE